MKKILFVANVGKEHILKFHVPTIRKFKDEGWQVDVMCAGEEPIPYCDNHIIAKWKRKPFNFDLFKGIRQLKKYLDENYYDVIYCHTPVGGVVSRIAAKKTRKKGTKVIYCAHGLHLFKGAPLLNWMVYYPVEKYLAKHTDAIFTINNEDHNLVRERFQKGLYEKQLPGIGTNFERLNVADAEAVRREYRAQMNIPSDAAVLVYVAEINKNKNQIMLLNAMSELVKEQKPYYLLLVGPAHDGGKLERLIAEKGLTERIKLLGWRSDIGNLLTCADFCVASSYREGLAINLVEAMYCGLRIVATNNRGHEAVITDGQNGFLVPVNDNELMVKRIKEIEADKNIVHIPAKEDLMKYESNHVACEIYSEISALCEEK